MLKVDGVIIFGVGKVTVEDLMVDSDELFILSIMFQGGGELNLSSIETVFRIDVTKKGKVHLVFFLSVLNKRERGGEQILRIGVEELVG